MPALQFVTSSLMAGLLFVTCAVTVTIFGLNSEDTIDNMSDTTKRTAYELVDALLKERVDLTASRLSNEFIQPPMDMVKMGIHIAENQQLNLTDKFTAFSLVRTMISSIIDSTFLEEAWVLKYENGFLVHGVKGLKPSVRTDPFSIKYLLESNDSQITYTDRLPLPDERDITRFQTVIPSSRFISDEFLDLNDNIARKWTIPQTDPSGILEIGYGLPLFPNMPAYTNIWILTEFMMPFIRPLLQSMVDGVEVYTEDTYDAPTYAPHTNESILCLAERVTGLLVECSHGFGAVLSKDSTGGETKWDREIARTSVHPVVGPAFESLFEKYGTLSNVNHDDLIEFATTGTERFPIPVTKFFLRSTSITTDGLDWIAVAVTPYDSVMKSVDDDTNESRDSAKSAVILSIVISISICLVAIAIVIAFTHMFTRPISELKYEMQQVEAMNLRTVEADIEKVSFFTEITAMNKSFQEMVKMLIQYKRYLPSHLQGNEDTDDAEESQSQIGTERGGIDIITTIRSSHSRSTSQIEPVKNPANLFALELNDKCTCSVVTLTFTDELSMTSAKTAFNDTLEEISRRSISHRVKPHIIVNNNTIQLVFNTAALCPSHPEKALLFAFGMRKVCSATSICVTHGKVISGNVGSQHHRFHVAIGTAFKKAELIARFVGSAHHVYCDTGIMQYSSGFTHRRVHQLCLKDASGDRSFGLFEVLGERSSTNQEWMYSLEENETSGPALLNTAFDLVLSGNFEAASVKIQDIHKDYSNEVATMKRLMKDYPERDGVPDWFKGMSESIKYEESLS
eukprot:TRINITY_DN9446_c0_g1_i1.p1 TRINITY_DN9446_c0_g1~~TRINITY_DN9446_c0_g1_i1.p1  ORF type:complete len:796 (+),score=136.68 TRINITY_DN9446_c0_g1_i1:82-2469(+)